MKKPIGIIDGHSLWACGDCGVISVHTETPCVPCEALAWAKSAQGIASQAASKASKWDVIG